MNDEEDEEDEEDVEVEEVEEDLPTAFVDFALSNADLFLLFMLLRRYIRMDK